jgi:hypothetical protein
VFQICNAKCPKSLQTPIHYSSDFCSSESGRSRGIRRDPRPSRWYVGIEKFIESFSFIHDSFLIIASDELSKRGWTNFQGGYGKRNWNNFGGGYGKRDLEV